MNADLFQQAREVITPGLIEHFFPGGEWRQGEYWPCSPLRADKTPGSFSINEKGLYNDFVPGGGSGDFIDLVAKARGLAPLEAADLIIKTGGNGHDKTVQPPAAKKAKAAPVIPIPGEALPGFKVHARGKFIVERSGPPVDAWKYEKDGQLWCITARHEKDGAKDIIPYYYGTDNKFHQGNPLKDNRPLFNVDKLTGNDLPVLIVEGEKCASVSVPGYVLVTWIGGSKAVHKSDWAPLQGRAVIVWPDCDDAGFAAALAIKERVPQAEILSITDKPKGWDIADAEKEGIDLVKFINECPRIKPPAQNDELFPAEVQAVIVPSFDRLPRPEKIKLILNQNFDFRYHRIRGCTQFKKKNAVNFQDFNDRHFNTIRSRLICSCINPLPEGDLRMVLKSCFVPEYDPVREYFDTLPAWDGEDHIRELAELVEVVPGQYGEEIDAAEVWTSYLFRWMIACVAQMLGTYENHQCLTLLGEKQGAGKTTFLRKLGIAEDLVYTGALDPHDKDSKIALVEYVLAVMDELEATTKHDMASLKSFMTLKSINVRRPYAERSERLSRLASFAASANNVQILGDITGSRRWLCTEVESIDYMAVTPELVQSAYSQAYAALKAGVKYWFDMDEIKKLESQNAGFQEACPEEEALLAIYERCEFDAFVAEYLTNTEILQKLSYVNPAVKFSQRRLGQVLRKRGFARGMKGGTYKYAVTKKNK